MELNAARALAAGLLREHGLLDWTPAFDRAKTRAGVCRYATRQIGLSRDLTLLHDEAQVRETVLHEIAHALAGPAAGHGPRWRAVARRLGCSDARCLPQDAPRVAGPWTGTCPAGHTTTRHRRPERVLSCRRCGRGFRRDAVIEWRYRGERVPMPPSYVAELARIHAAGGATGAAARGAAATPPPRAPAGGHPSLAVGTRVRLRGGGRFGGLTGTVEKRGRTRYHVRTAIGLVTAPPALVEPH